MSLLVEQRRKSSLNRWLFEGEIEEESENNERNIISSVPSITTTVKQPMIVQPTVSAQEAPLIDKKESCTCSCGANKSIDQAKLAEMLKESLETMQVPIAPPSQPRSEAGQGTNSVANRRRSSISDPRISWEKRLSESQAKEKQAQVQIADLQRKIVSLEDRIRAIKNDKKRIEKKNTDALENKIALAVAKIVEGRELDSAMKDKIAEAVASAVAQTLLSAAVPIQPPSRQPPRSSISKNQLMLI